MATEYIEKQATIDEVYARCAGEHWEDIVRSLPPADVRPVVRGRWELAEDGWYCTACKLYPPFDCDPEEKGVPFCPWCAADMRGEKDE